MKWSKNGEERAVNGPGCSNDTKGNGEWNAYQCPQVGAGLEEEEANVKEFALIGEEQVEEDEGA